VATTDAAGRFTIRTRLVHDNLVRGYVAADPARHIAAGASDLTPVVARAALSSFVAPATGVVNRWWRMDGRSAPGSLRTMLWVWNGSFWTSQSFGPAAADGTFTRWWKPTSTGTHRLRLELSGPFNSNLPIERQVSVAVRSLQTVPTYLDGRTGSTTGSIVRRSTQMSTFGHLRVRHGNGVVGPFVRQVVSIQARPVGAGAWRQVGTATTTSSGYFHARWLMPYTDDSEVRIAYTSPYETIRSTVLDQGVVDVR
jgi:hypothetical protein